MLRKYCNYCPILSPCCSVREKEGKPCVRENNTPSKCENHQQVFNEIIVLPTEHKRCLAYCTIIVVRGDLFKTNCAVHRFQSIDLRLRTYARVTRRSFVAMPLFGRISKMAFAFCRRGFLPKKPLVFNPKHVSRTGRQPCLFLARSVSSIKSACVKLSSNGRNNFSFGVLLYLYDTRTGIVLCGSKARVFHAEYRFAKIYKICITYTRYNIVRR